MIRHKCGPTREETNAAVRAALDRLRSHRQPTVPEFKHAVTQQIYERVVLPLSAAHGYEVLRMKKEKELHW